MIEGRFIYHNSLAKTIHNHFHHEPKLQGLLSTTQSELGGPLVVGGDTGGRVVVGVAAFSDGDRQEDQQQLPLVFTNLTSKNNYCIQEFSNPII